MLICYHYFLLKLFNLLLLHLLHLLHHIISRDKHCIKEAWVCESLYILHFTLEIDLAMILGSILLSLQLFLFIALLFNIWDKQVIHGGWMWLLWVFIEIGLLHMDIKSGLGLPFCFILQFLLHLYLILIYQWERQ